MNAVIPSQVVSVVELGVRSWELGVESWELGVRS
jgi:hypothetical protein